MSLNRRYFIKKIFTLVIGVWSIALPKTSFSNWRTSDFGRVDLDSTLAAIFPDITLKTSTEIYLKLPKIAENGAVVPITITSSIEQAEVIYLLAEKNPVPLIAKFNLNPHLETFIGARFKMKETCDVIVVIKAGDQYYQIRQKVKVTLGGCGG